MNELGDGTIKWNRKMVKCAGTPNSYTTNDDDDDDDDDDDNKNGLRGARLYLRRCFKWM